MKKRMHDLEGLGQTLESTEAFRRLITRKQFVAGAGATGLGLFLAACGGNDVEPAAPVVTEPDVDVEGVAGGPSGFDGAERYHYEADSAPGRAIGAFLQLKEEGRAPDRIVFGVYAGADGNYTQPFPEGAQSVFQLWEELTGVPIEVAPVAPEDAIPQATQMAATRDGSQHIVQVDLHSVGDLAEAGLLLDLSENVGRYQPDWNDPEWGYIGGEQTTQMFNYYQGRPYAVGSDGDYQLYVIRRDLWEDPQEQEAFEARYGYPLEPPRTWDQQGDMAEFFHRPDQGLLGATDLRSPAWGWINFVHRYVSTQNPVAFYWDDEMNPLVNGEGGLKALNHLIETTRFGSPDALTWIWEQQYVNWGQGGAAQTVAFNNITKFMKDGGPFDVEDFSAEQNTWAIPTPGWEVDGTLVRHTSIYFNAAFGVNAFSPSEFHEALYLLLQWVASGPIYTWLTANPAGFQDPCKVSTLTDPLVRQTYTERTVDVLGMTIPGAAPPITGQLQGAIEYIQALDINLQRALSGQAQPQAALDAIASDWNRITDRIGRDKQIESWQAAKAAWPTVADSAEGAV
jgi:multiple sugar transport system substrate-binding protein